MLPRIVTAVVGLVLMAAVAVGCVPEPEPTPTATVFASEEEAFAAAEETYRAYVDALNQVDLSDPETFEAVYAWTTGDANAGERKTLTDLQAQGLTVSGGTETVSFTPESFEADGDPVVSARVCSDVSAVALVDSEGNSAVSPDRRDVYALDISFTHARTATSLAIASSTAVEDPTCTR